MALNEEFIGSHIFPLRNEHNVYELDVRMCQIVSLQYDFQWRLQPHQRSAHSPDEAGLELSALDTKVTTQPFKVVAINASLNELTEIYINSLSPFTNLRSLDLSLNAIRKMCSLRPFRSLTKVNLSHNKLQDISFLSEENNVVELNLSVNEIEHLVSLPSQHSLTTLHLNENRIRSLEGIQSLPYLKELHIQRNDIDSLLPLTANRNLMCINAAYNKIDSLRTTANSIQQIHQLKSVILLGNPVEANPEYQSVLRKKESLTSLDNITLKRDLSHIALTRDTENMGNLRDVAQQAFWNQLALRRDQKDEQIRFLRQRILQLEEEFKDHEDRLKAELEATLLHLSDLTANPGTSSRQPWHNMEPNQLSRERRAADSPIQLLPAGDRKGRSKGNYKGVTDTDEILRLASTELFHESNSKNPS